MCSAECLWNLIKGPFHHEYVPRSRVWMWLLFIPSLFLSFFRIFTSVCTIYYRDHTLTNLKLFFDAAKEHVKYHASDKFIVTGENNLVFYSVSFVFNCECKHFQVNVLQIALTIISVVIFETSIAFVGHRFTLTIKKGSSAEMSKSLFKKVHIIRGVIIRAQV